MGLHDTPIYKRDWNDTEFSPGKTVFVVSLSILNVFMLLGNIMSIVTIAVNPSLRRRVSYWFVLNLAITDTVISIIVIPFDIVWEYYGNWPLGTSACKFVTFADNSFSTISAYSIVLVSVDKYLYITYAIHYYSHMTKRLGLSLILAIWICVGVYSSVSNFAGLASSHFEEDIEDTCIFLMKDAHAIVAAVFSFFIPLAILCFTTSRIICIAHRHIRKIHATPSFSYTEAVSEVSVCEGSNSTKVTNIQLPKRASISIIPCSNKEPDFRDSTNSTKLKTAGSSMDLTNVQFDKNKLSVLKNLKNTQQHERLRAVKSCPTLEKMKSSSRSTPKGKPYCRIFGTVTIVIICFILMFAPYYIALMIDVGCHCVEPWIYEDILTVLCHSHALVNPYIYISTDRKYKTAFKNILKKLCRIPCSGNAKA